jgi:hypothetical protein
MSQLRSLLGKLKKGRSVPGVLKIRLNPDWLLYPQSWLWLTSTRPSQLSSWTPQAVSTFVLMSLPPLTTRYQWALLLHPPDVRHVSRSVPLCQQGVQWWSLLTLWHQVQHEARLSMALLDSKAVDDS